MTADDVARCWIAGAHRAPLQWETSLLFKLTHYRNFSRGCYHGSASGKMQPMLQRSTHGLVYLYVLCGVIFLSGCSALIFESVWFYLCGLALGNSVWAANAVLSSFMGGLALGNGLASRYGITVKRYLAAYAAIETVIGSTGFGLTLLLPVLSEML